MVPLVTARETLLSHLQQETLRSLLPTRYWPTMQRKHLLALHQQGIVLNLPPALEQEEVFVTPPMQHQLEALLGYSPLFRIHRLHILITEERQLLTTAAVTLEWHISQSPSALRRRAPLLRLSSSLANFIGVTVYPQRALRLWWWLFFYRNGCLDQRSGRVRQEHLLAFFGKYPALRSGKELPCYGNDLVSDMCWETEEISLPEQDQERGVEGQGRVSEEEGVYIDEERFLAWREDEDILQATIWLEWGKWCAW